MSSTWWRASAPKLRSASDSQVGFVVTILNSTHHFHLCRLSLAVKTYILGYRMPRNSSNMHSWSCSDWVAHSGFLLGSQLSWAGQFVTELVARSSCQHCQYMGSFPLTVTVTTVGYRSYKNPLNKAPLRTVTGRGNDPINTTEVGEGNNNYCSLHFFSFVSFCLAVLGLGSWDADPISNLALTAALLLGFVKLQDAFKNI